MIFASGMFKGNGMNDESELSVFSSSTFLSVFCSEQKVSISRRKSSYGEYIIDATLRILWFPINTSTTDQYSDIHIKVYLTAEVDITLTLFNVNQQAKPLKVEKRTPQNLRDWANFFRADRSPQCIQ